MIQYGDNNYMKTVTSGNSNVYRYYGSGRNKAYVCIYTSNAVVELKQQVVQTSKLNVVVIQFTIILCLFQMVQIIMHTLSIETIRQQIPAFKQ